MATIRLTREFRFEMAHALWNYDGPCRNIHGHSYILQVTVMGKPGNKLNDPKLGMVMDFSTLKKIIHDKIIDVFDHSVMLNDNSPGLKHLNISQLFEKHYFVDYQPTCENMVADFAERIKKHLPPHIQLYSLRLYETINSFAEWYASDNE